MPARHVCQNFFRDALAPFHNYRQNALLDATIFRRLSVSGLSILSYSTIKLLRYCFNALVTLLTLCLENVKVIDDVAGNVVTIKERKTGKLKVFPINNRAREIISRRRVAYPKDKFLFQSKSNRMKNQPARAITRESASRAFSEAGEMVTDKHINGHSARKCRGRTLWETGTPIETISKMLNHSSPGGHHDIP